MNKTSIETIEILKKYPNAKYELNENSIIVKKNNDNGFSVSLAINGDENYTVAFDIWHEEFDNEIYALHLDFQKIAGLKLPKKVENL